MEISQIIPHVESLIFAADRPLPVLEIVDLLNNALAFLEDRATLDQVETAVEAIREKYHSEFYAFEVRESGGGYQFLTKKDYYQTVAQLNGEKFLKRLSTAALETLAIIAYKQPISKGEIEHIRGVSSDYSIQKLLEKELIIISGRSEELPGKPLLYATSKAFMDYFGLNSPADLPKLREVFDEEAIQPTLITEEAFNDNGGMIVSENGELLEDAFIPTITIEDEGAHTQAEEMEATDAPTENSNASTAANTEETTANADTDVTPEADSDTDVDNELSSPEAAAGNNFDASAPDLANIGPGPGDDEVENEEEDDLHEDLGDEDIEDEEEDEDDEDFDDEDDDEEEDDDDDEEEDDDEDFDDEDYDEEDDEDFDDDEDEDEDNEEDEDEEKN
ncbi:MAG TPA: SMC-Scp complex subunit ScpB [Chitinophaga sp.]|uniref:SMC-Scp complex subunit ScpB n=1 Tax=Chitinophaga sp. TaxID=1869181 RepID=UPI002DB8876B|nr:SMC-Scp complex subunit ScpB [Chitinophaga sp.]HEU4554695.1 SMC-Scp complex subunit ScpB [Chitinophaga sp.]